MALGFTAAAALVSALLATLALPAFTLGFLSWIALVPIGCE